MQALHRSFSFAYESIESNVHTMSLAEIESKVLALSEEERREFATWFFQNQGKILPPPLDEDDEDAADISPEVMEELLRRRAELDEGNVKLCTIEEMEASMDEAINEVRRSRR